MKNPNKPNRWKYVLWWKIDPVELRNQIDHYDSLPWHKTARKVSAALLLFSSVLTAIMAGSGWMNPVSILDGIILGTLGVFVWFGLSWAMLLAMAIWTIEKGYMLVQLPTQAVSSIIFWMLYMSQLYLAYRVEQQRDREEEDSLTTFFKKRRDDEVKESKSA